MDKSLRSRKTTIDAENIERHNVNMRQMNGYHGYHGRYCSAFVFISFYDIH